MRAIWSATPISCLRRRQSSAAFPLPGATIASRYVQTMTRERNIPMGDKAQEGSLPLAGVRVVDLTRVMTGPYATMMLGDLGADVIKIELPGRGDDTRGWGPPFLEGESSYFLSINRNKESVTLDFKKTEGRELPERLVAKSEVLVESFRPGTLETIGFD